MKKVIIYALTIVIVALVLALIDSFVWHVEETFIESLCFWIICLTLVESGVYLFKKLFKK